MVLEILEKMFLKILKILSYNFQSRKQILTLRGVYFLEILSPSSPILGHN